MSNPTNNKIEDCFKADLFKTLGVRIDEFKEEWISDKFTIIGKFAISPSMCGPVGAMFKTITCEVSMGYARNNLHILYCYRYEHQDGGNNGHDVRRHLEVNKTPAWA